ncbi:hypothetical protein SE91_05800 [Bradyrhizobium sp. DOA1]|nr:hypothetical protein SE91_05800 [Bradyrhizobium sp. DOA1]
MELQYLQQSRHKQELFFGASGPFRGSFSLRLANAHEIGRAVFFLGGFVVLTGAFTLQIAGVDPSLPRQFSDGSMLSQIITATIYLVSLMLFARSSQPFVTVVRACPVFLLPAMAFASALWAPDAELTIRRSFALLGTILFALALGSSYTLKDTIRFVLRALILVMLLSMIWATAFPEAGVHQASDALEPIHAGRWRGVFSHKNSLGAVAGFTLGMLALYGRLVTKSPILRAAAIGAATICLTFAGSGTGFVTALNLILIGILMQLVIKTPLDLRLAVLLLFTAIVALFFSFADSAVALALEALGKSPDLTGRTLYWNYVLSFMGQHWLMGYGYFSGFLSIGATIASITSLDLGSTHNGYLDIIVSFGLVGLVVLIFYLCWLIFQGTRLLLASNAPSLEATFPICVVFHAIQLNVVESGFLAANSLWPLLMALAATMLVRVNNYAAGNAPQYGRHRRRNLGPVKVQA